MSIEQFFSEVGQEIERSFRLVRRELIPGGEAETALIYLYQQATLGLEPRQKIATRKPPGTKQIISRELILEAALAQLREEVANNKASVPPDRLPVLEPGFPQRVFRRLEGVGGVSPSKSVVYDIINGKKFMFLLAMKYEGR